jgi:hypothetical protein
MLEEMSRGYEISDDPGQYMLSLAMLDGTADYLDCVSMFL